MKRAKRESQGVACGEEVLMEDKDRNKFLMGALTKPEGHTRQAEWSGW